MDSKEQTLKWFDILKIMKEENQLCEMSKILILISYEDQGWEY